MLLNYGNIKLKKPNDISLNFYSTNHYVICTIDR